MKSAMGRIAWGVGLAILFAFQAFVVASYFFTILSAHHRVVTEVPLRGWLSCGALGCVVYVERLYWKGVRVSSSIPISSAIARRVFLIYVSFDASYSAYTLNWAWLSIPMLVLLADSALSLKFDIKATRQNASISS